MSGVKWVPLVIAGVLLAAAPARAQYPEMVVSGFLEADGRGDRLHAARAAALAEAYGGRFEPAWDRVLLVTGYETQPLRVSRDEAEIEVRYTVVAELTGEGIDDRERIDAVRYQMIRVGGIWRLIGPLPPPHLFASAFDREDLNTLLMPLGVEYISNSKFVWQMFQNATWSVPYRPVSSYLAEGVLRPVAEPRVGDVVAYLDRGVPYHAGLYVGEDRVASATMNAGIVRTSLNAFPGEIRYLRLTEAARPTPTGSPDAEPTPAAAGPE